MRAEFWHERWEKGEIGFHQQEFNPWMQGFIGRLGVGAGAHILVPLCGKSLDMLWLADQGYQVTGIEISELAIKDFFSENHMEHEITRQAGTIHYRSENIDIHCADIFRMGPCDLPPVDAVYDRASLIALPPDMRPAYAEQLLRLVADGTRILLVTADYHQEEMRGPPFSVTPAEVGRLFGSNCRIEHLHSEDCLAREPRFRKKGLTRLDENVFVLQKAKKL
jgi:thiopurine S-methyltransferase